MVDLNNVAYCSECGREYYLFLDSDCPYCGTETTKRGQYDDGENAQRRGQKDRGRNKGETGRNKNMGNEY